MITGALMLALGTAHAQEPATLATFLEKRVPDELAVEGVMLSRRDLSLKVEQVGEQLLISLVDLRSGQVVAATKLASVPDDREAAVAAVTHVVADLSRQVGPTPPAPPAQTRVETLVDQRAEQQYREDALRIGERYELDGTARHPSLSRRWVIYRGEQNHVVEPADFYDTIGRHDFAVQYQDNITRRNHAIFAGALFATGAVASMVIGAIVSASNTKECDINQPDFSNCVKSNVDAGEHSGMASALVPTLLFTAAFGISAAIAWHYHNNANPVTEDEAMSLADQYNHGLRHHLGLPSARSEPIVKSLQLSPSPTGLALGGTF